MIKSTVRLFTYFALALCFSCILTSCGKESQEKNKEIVTSEKQYEKELKNVSEYSREMPVVYIQTLNQGKNVMRFVTEPVKAEVAKTMSQWHPEFADKIAPYYEACSVSLIENLTDYSVDHAYADVKVRGNWSTTFDKKSLRIKFDKKQSMLGLNEGNAFKNWVLLAGYKDGSLERDVTALSLARELFQDDEDVYVADATYVSVIINDEYWGVYILTELQETGKNRVNVTKAKDDYTSTDIGYFFEFTYAFSEINQYIKRFHVSYADNAPLIPYDGNGGSGEEIYALPAWPTDKRQDLGFEIKSDIYSKEQNAFITNFVENTYRIMYEAAYNDKAYCFDAEYKDIYETSDITPREAVEAVVDMDSLVNMYILCELTADPDLNAASFYMSADFGEGGSRKLVFTAPWDFDCCFGEKCRCVDGTGFYAGNKISDSGASDLAEANYYTVNPWLAVLAYEDWFLASVRDRWSEVYDAGLFDDIYEDIEEASVKYQFEFEQNYKRWNNLVDKSASGYGKELSQEARNCKTQTEAKDYLISWLRKRVDFMNSSYHN